jgi:hypothetical protein
MSVAVKDDPKLWASVKAKWMKGSKGGPAGKWNARKAMLAVNEYKSHGGGYVGKRDPNNSLKKWQKEDWGYAGPGGRYLPKAVRVSLTPAERRRENALKRGKLGQWVPYSKSVNEKMKAKGIYGKKAVPKTDTAPKKKTAPKKADTKKKTVPKKAAPKKKTAPKCKSRAKK